MFYFEKVFSSLGHILLQTKACKTSQFHFKYNLALSIYKYTSLPYYIYCMFHQLLKRLILCERKLLSVDYSAERLYVPRDINYGNSNDLWLYKTKLQIHRNSWILFPFKYCRDLLKQIKFVELVNLFYHSLI